MLTLVVHFGRYLLKAFHCLSRELLVARLDVYGFDKSSLQLTHSYLSNREKKVKKMANIVRGAIYCLEFYMVQF